MLLLHLVRHGESTWNAAGLLQGCTPHVPLTALGTRQAEAAATLLAARPVDAVVASDQRRAHDTAVVIAGPHGLPVVTTEGFREQCHGRWEGGAAAGRADLVTAAAADWAPPGGESARALHARVGAALSALFARAPGTEIVVVSHGETLRAVIAQLTGTVHVPAPPNGVPLTLAGRPGGTWCASTLLDRGHRTVMQS